MRIPKKLKIGGRNYQVQFHKEGEICSENADCGKTVRTKGVIEINSSLIQSEQEATLLHEIFHIINPQIDHSLLESLSQQFYQVLKDNNLLV